MLNNVLRVNALSCASFGLIFILFAQAVAKTIGTPPTLLVQCVGAVLIANAVLLFWSSKQEKPNTPLIMFFIAGDVMWVLASLALISAGLWITTALGIAFTIIVALFVGACGALQWKYLPA